VGRNYYYYDEEDGGHPVTPGATCIFADPLFVNDGQDDYHLKLSPPVVSPCIDVGLNPELTGQEQYLAKDLDDRPRPVDIEDVGNDGTSSAYADMGAYERQR
jgi:hypothetical protein